ncbi:unnamed protein product [Microthlaspi erraticum]|uniref:RRM domain-containing protein n=1 Tax=Microthlaspi erraticum TaxID=1685480 RepID=A0A6D2KGW2_9BRAS|nr:unnamed protein product [Microthlaspi erraticum]
MATVSRALPLISPRDYDAAMKSFHANPNLRDSSCAFMVIIGEDAEEKALALDGSDAGGWNVSVVKAGKKEETREEVEAFLAVLNDKNRRFGISVTGFDTSLSVDDLKAALRREFASCGEILHVYIPRYRSIGYVYFSGEEALARALDLHGPGSRCTLFRRRPQAQARAVDSAGWDLLALPIPCNKISTSGSGGMGYTIPPHVVEWTTSQRKGY